MPYSCIVRLKSGEKHHYSVADAAGSIEDVHKAFRSEIEKLQCSLVLVPNCGSQINYVEPTEAA